MMTNGPAFAYLLGLAQILLSVHLVTAGNICEVAVTLDGLPISLTGDFTQTGVGSTQYVYDATQDVTRK